MQRLYWAFDSRYQNTTIHVYDNSAHISLCKLIAVTPTTGWHISPSLKPVSVRGGICVACQNELAEMDLADSS